MHNDGDEMHVLPILVEYSREQLLFPEKCAEMFLDNIHVSMSVTPQLMPSRYGHPLIYYKTLSMSICLKKKWSMCVLVYIKDILASCHSLICILSKSN